MQLYQSSFTRIHPTVIQKVILGIGASVGPLVNPLRDDLVATLGEITGEVVIRNVRDKMLQSEEGRKVLRNRPRVTSASLDFENLAKLPDNTFGKQHFLFFRDNKITPDSRKKVQFIADDELAYTMQRYRENHDFLHTLTGLSISVTSEIALKWFEFKQTGLPMTFLSAIFGPLKLKRHERIDLFNLYFPWAEKASVNSKFFMDFEYEKLLDQDINNVRQLLNLIPFSPTI